MRAPFLTRLCASIEAALAAAAFAEASEVETARALLSQAVARDARGRSGGHAWSTVPRP